MIVLQRSPKNLIRAFALAQRARAQSKTKERARVSAMFWKGAVKALALHPEWSEARHARASG